ncbi:MAG: Gfo/Idh/MocA family oxidoreductase [Bacteroidales bacterium]|jgi:hypothetical protein|nr:Gfo/Idh/MocA family oxidoreductase [Bacteroidales bacterium]
MVRIGIIGTDESAHRHTTVLLANNTFEIVGYYDYNNRDSMLLARKYRLISYSSLDALFKYSDAIDISADMPGIFTLAEKSLKALKHLYIAYPHSLTADELQYLLKLADESEVVLQLGTKHNYCPVCNFASQTGKMPQTVHICHLLNRKEQHPLNRLKTELPYDLSLALNVLNSNIIKIDPHVEMTGSTVFRCRMECDNGILVTVAMHLDSEEAEKLTLRFSYPDMEMEMDVFHSVADIYYNEFDVGDHKLLEPYNERNICRKHLEEFAAAMQRNQDMASMDLHMQCFIAADLAIDYVRQMPVVKTLSGSYQGFSPGE